MENFKSTFEAFLRHELERDELAQQLEKKVKQTPTLSTEIVSYMTKLHQDKRLPTEDYSVLKSMIEPFYEKTRLAPPRRTRRTDNRSNVNKSVPQSDWSHRRASWSRPSQWEPAEETIIEPGLIIRDNYRLEEEVGKGGMGVVWKAIDLIQEAGDARDCHVAIKFLSQDFKQHPDALKALVREFNRYKRLTHPKIVKAHSLDRLGSTFFMVMEFLKGIPLNKVIKNHPNGLSLTEAEPIIRDMTQALAHAHEEGIAHLDFKPANVFYDPDAKSAKVIDFGISRPLKQSERDETKFDPITLGALTDAYASNEMFLGLEPDPRDDIYGLACVTYELLSGKHPFKRKKAAKADYEKLSPEPIEGLKTQQNKALSHALAFERDERTATASQFLAEFFPEKQKLSWGLVGGGVIVLVLAIGAGFAAWEMFKPPPVNKLPEDSIRPAQSENAAPRVDPEQPQITVAEQERQRLKEVKQQVEAARAEQEHQRQLLEEARQRAEAAKRERQLLEDASRQNEARRLELKAQVARLLQKCQKHFDALRLTTGRGGTALVCYREILELDADNVEAKAGLKAIEHLYQAWAERAFRKGQLYKVSNYLKGLERVNPHSPILAELRQRLEIERGN